MCLTAKTCLTLVIVFIFEIRAAPSNQLQNYVAAADEALKLVNCKTNEQFQNLSDFSFNARQIEEKDTACLSLQMFNDTGIINLFNISTTVLARFILRVQKGYRKVPFHNWHHGFSVLQFSFALIKRCRLVERNHFSPLEALALLTAAMCHDLDHPGSNNQFQVEVNSSLAQKYNNEGSILERHHIDVTFDILKKSDTNFISHFDKKKQMQFRELISQIILATDLTMHLKLLPEMKKMSTAGSVEFSEQNKKLLRSIIISCADLSDQSKDWAASRTSARLILTEFFNQGDKEKQLGLVPLKMMDRNLSEVPNVEVDFLTHVVVPNFKILKSLYSETNSCLNNTQQNLIFWKISIPYFQKESSFGRTSLDILNDSELSNISSLEII